MDIDALLTASERCRVAGRHVEGAALAAQANAVAGAAPAQEARAQALMAVHQLRLGDFETAIRHGLLALAHEMGSGNLAAQSQLHSTVAFAYLSSKLEQQALRHVILALDTARAGGDLNAECWALSRAGMIYEALGDSTRGLDYGRQALALARGLPDDEALFAALNNMTSGVLTLYQSASAQGQNHSALLHQALADAQEAVALARAQRSAHREAIASSNMGMVLVALQRVDEGQEVMAQALAQAQAGGFRALAVDIELDLAVMLHAQGRHAQALAQGQALQARVDDKQDAEVALRLHQKLYEWHKASGQFEAALAQHERLHALKLLQAEQTAGLQSRILINRLELEEARTQADRSQLDAVMQRRRAEDLDRQAHSDALTGLLNRRFVDHQLPQLVQRAHERGLPLAAAMIDIDHFKAVNDGHGHAVGDRVLAELASLLRQATRGSDIAARMGGEEFLVVLVDTPQDLALEVCERLRHTVQQHAWPVLAAGLACTISVGLHLLAPDEDMARWLARADALLYAAKRGGRNRVMLTTN
jgi:diguanylate cyclase (GGDEF)-like protein